MIFAVNGRPPESVKSPPRRMCGHRALSNPPARAYSKHQRAHFVFRPHVKIQFSELTSP